MIPRWFVVALAVFTALILPILASGQTFDVTGTVTLPDGKPAAGAKVTLLWPENTPPVTADSAGNFAIKLEPGEHILRAWSSQFVSDKYYSISVDPDGKITGSTQIQLEPGTIVVGKMIDKTTGKPVASAKVMLERYGSVRTLDDGTFTFEAVKREVHTIQAVKDGFSYPSLKFSAVGQDHVDLTLETQPEAVINGTVTDDKGNPVKGVCVYSPGSRYDLQRTTTNENGSYVLHGFNPEEVARIQTDSGGYEWQDEQQVTFAEGKREAVVDFKLVPKVTSTRTITGRVTRFDGTPVVEALVSYGWTDTAEGYTETQTDQDGRYVLRDVNTQKNLVVAQAEGLAPAFKFVDENVSAEIDLSMLPGHSLSGKFIDEEGSPVENAWISLSVRTDEMQKTGIGLDYYRWANIEATTANDGSFTLSNLPADGVLIEAAAQGFSRIDSLPLAVDKTDHVITIKRPRQVCGTVVDARTGKPITKLTLHDAYSAGSDSVEVNAPGGKFVYRDPYARERNIGLIIQADGYLSAKLSGITAQSASKLDYNALTIKLKPSRPFTANISDAETGKPIRGAKITALDLGGEGDLRWQEAPSFSKHFSAESDATGKARIESETSRFGCLLVEKSGYGRIAIREVDFFKPLKIKLSKGASIKGIATDQDGKLLPNAFIYVRWMGERRERVAFLTGKADANGAFSVGDLPAGEYRITAGITKRLLTIKLGKGENRVIDWDKNTGYELDLSATFAGKPCDQANVTIFPLDSEDYVALGQTDADGKAIIRLAEPGTYRVAVSKGSYDTDLAEERITVNVKKGENLAQVALSSASVSGKLTSTDGKVLPNTELSAYIYQTDKDYLIIEDWYRSHTKPVWWGVKRTTTDSEGRFTFKNLREGRWVIVQKVSGVSQISLCAPFEIKKDEHKVELNLQTPPIGSAEVALVDKKTGKAVDQPFALCVDGAGMSNGPDQSKTAGGGG